MKVQITARHFHASQHLHQNLKESLENLAKFNDSMTGAHIILDAEKSGVHRAEGIIKIMDKSVCAEAEDGVMGKAIDAMLEKIERQLKKENQKLKGHKSVPMSATVVG